MWPCHVNTTFGIWKPLCNKALGVDGHMVRFNALLNSEPYCKVVQSQKAQDIIYIEKVIKRKKRNKILKKDLTGTTKIKACKHVESRTNSAECTYSEWMEQDFGAWFSKDTSHPPNNSNYKLWLHYAVVYSPGNITKIWKIFDWLLETVKQKQQRSTCEAQRNGSRSWSWAMVHALDLLLQHKVFQPGNALTCKRGTNVAKVLWEHRPCSPQDTTQCISVRGVHFHPRNCSQW